MNEIITMEPPLEYTDKQKFDYWYMRANELYNTRYEAFQDDAEKVFYSNAMIYYIQQYMFYRDLLDKECKELLKLTSVMWLTYNPRKDVTLNKALEAVNSFVQKLKITNYIYVIEQRGTSETDMGDFHVHILHKHKYDRVTHYKRETQSTFRKTCLVTKFNCLYFAPCYTDDDVKKRLNYILGDKQDLDGLNKARKQEIDKIYRQKYMLKDYYTDDFTHWEQYS